MTDEQKPVFDEPEENSARANVDANAGAADEESSFGQPYTRPPANLERLQKILAQAGVASRRAAEELIRQGRVQVNGQIVTELGTKADAARDHIRVDGKLLHGAERLRYFVLNKPKGYVTTVKDPEGRPTVMEFFAKTGERLYPVGRLDYQSEGLLLVTNDGLLANALTRAASGVEKTYLVKVAGQPGEELLERLRTGVSIDRGKLGEGRVQTAPARIRQVRPGENPWFEVVLIEGRNRELRKMFEEIGHHVEKIRRVGYGPLVLDVEPGKFRVLDPGEVEALRLTASGKLKPKRVKATRMLPKEAGLSVEQRAAKAERSRRVGRPPGRGFKPSFKPKFESKFEPKFKSKFNSRPRPGFSAPPRLDREETPDRQRESSGFGSARPFREARPARPDKGRTGERPSRPFKGKPFGKPGYNERTGERAHPAAGSPKHSFGKPVSGPGSRSGGHSKPGSGPRRNSSPRPGDSRPGGAWKSRSGRPASGLGGNSGRDSRGGRTGGPKSGPKSGHIGGKRTFPPGGGGRKGR